MQRLLADFRTFCISLQLSVVNPSNLSHLTSCKRFASYSFLLTFQVQNFCSLGSAHIIPKKLDFPLVFVVVVVVVVVVGNIKSKINTQLLPRNTHVTELK